MMGIVREATFYDVIDMHDDMRQSVKDELWAIGALTPLEALTQELEFCEDCRVFEVDGKPLCIWGVYQDSIIGNSGRPWLMCTEALSKHKYEFIRLCKNELVSILSRYDILHNVVDVRNVAAIKWLKWMGFKFFPAEPWGVESREFYKYEMRKT